jgi:type II secretory pathway component PulJ
LVGRPAGFTLIEATVALTLSSVVVILVSTVFLVQNRYYQTQLARTQVHDAVRVMTETVASELRSVAKGGVKAAESDRIVVRSPVVLVAVCSNGPGDVVAVQIDGGVAGLDTDEVTGFAVRDTLTDVWTYHDGAGWSTITETSGTPASDCAANGADTTGASADFANLHQLGAYQGYVPVVGQLLMLYREVEYSVDASTMEPTRLALFRTVATGTPVEFVTGVDPAAAFQYRTVGPTYANAVSGSMLDSIDAVRIVAEARRPPRTGGVGDVTYGWAVNVSLRNGG